MKASELVAKLQQLIEQHGDQELVLIGDDDPHYGAYTAYTEINVGAVEENFSVVNETTAEITPVKGWFWIEGTPTGEGWGDDQYYTFSGEDDEEEDFD